MLKESIVESVTPVATHGHLLVKSNLGLPRPSSLLFSLLAAKQSHSLYIDVPIFFMKENWLVMYTFFSSGANLTPYGNYEQFLKDI